MISPLYFVAVVLCILFSAFFSGSEIAYSSVNRMRLEAAAEGDDRRAKVALYIYENFERALSAILIGNNLVNIAASSIATTMAIILVGESATGVASILMTVLILVFGETMPKIMAKSKALSFATLVALPLRLLMTVLHPLIVVVVGFANLLTRPFHGDTLDEEEEAEMVEEELVSLIENVESEGIIDEERSELLQAALDFAEISAREVMTSRVDMYAIDIDDDPEEILHCIDLAPYSRVPVYEKSVDCIIGILYVNHFYRAVLDDPGVDLRGLLMEPCYVYKTMKLPSVLEQLKRKQQHLAIVTDDYGGTMGVVTMEDVLEQIVGEIWDETDVVEDDIVEKGDNLYEIDGDLSIYELLELLDIDEDDFETESATVGGWTIEMFDGFPEEGQSFDYENLHVTVLERDNLRVAKVRIELSEPEEKE